MQYLLAVSFLWLSFLKSRSKIISVGFFVFLWILFALNTFSPDRYNYEVIFAGGYGNHELGYMYLGRIFNQLGFSYQEFNAITATVVLVLLVIAIKNYTDSINMVLALFFIFPFLGYVSGVRQAISNMLILFSTKYILVYKRNAYNKIKFLFLILLASSIHYSAFIFIFGVFLPYKMKFKNKDVFLSVLFISFFALIVGYSNLFGELVKLVFESPKVLYWFNEQNRGRFGIFLSCFLHLWGFLLFRHGYKKLLYFYIKQKKCDLKLSEIYNKEQDEIDIISEKIKILNRVNLLNIVSFLLYGFYTYNTLFFSRLYPIILMINYTVFSESIKYAFKKKTKSRNMYIFMQIAYSFALFVLLYPWNRMDSLVSTIFNNNVLFGSFF